MQTQKLRICISPNILLPEHTAGFVCISSTDICEHKRRLGKKENFAYQWGRRCLERDIILLWPVNEVSWTKPQCTPTTRGFHRLAASGVYSSEIQLTTLRKIILSFMFLGSWVQWHFKIWPPPNEAEIHSENLKQSQQQLQKKRHNVATDSNRLLIPECNQSELQWIDRRKWSHRVVVLQRSAANSVIDQFSSDRVPHIMSLIQ